MEEATAGVSSHTMMYGRAVLSLSLKLASCLLSDDVHSIASSYRQFSKGKPQLLRNLLVNLNTNSEAPAFLSGLTLAGGARHLSKTRLFSLGVVLAVLGELYSQHEVAHGRSASWSISAEDLLAHMKPILRGEPGSKPLAMCLHEACSGNENHALDALFYMFAEPAFIKLREYMQCLPNEVNVCLLDGRLVIHESSLDSICIVAALLLSALRCMWAYSSDALAAYRAFQQLWLVPLSASGYLESFKPRQVPVWLAGRAYPFIPAGGALLQVETPLPSPRDDDSDVDCPRFGV